MSRNTNPSWQDQQWGFPYGPDQRGRTASPDLDRHVRELVEQVLFTSPGERVNRPTFGTDIRHAVFAPNSDELAAALEHLVQGALQQWLAEHIVVQRVKISAADGALTVDVAYLVKRDRQLREARFERSL
jgi:phage baseplate assembly protein W